MAEEFDLVIIGRGAAAFSAAIRGSEITSGQASIAMIGMGPIGGTCVNVGCVPSKYIIEASKAANIQRKPRFPGIEPIEPSISFSKLMNSLREVVEEERRSKYVEVLKSYSNILVFEGQASFASKDTVKITNNLESVELKGYNFIIATGSRPKVPPIDGLDETGYLTSDSVWSLDHLPKELGIIGGGFVGLEIGQALHRLGSNVKIIKEHETVARGIGRDFGDELIKALKYEGISFYTKREVKKVYKNNGKKVIETLHEGKKEKIEVEEVLISSGRVPNVDGLSLENAGVSFTGRGISAGNDLVTSNPSIYAAGDVVDQRYMLETLAAKEGAVAVSNIFEHRSKTINLHETPWAIFTEPQFASVGYSQEEYEKEFGSALIRSIPLSAVPKARILREEYGLFKMVVDEKTGKVVGMKVLSPFASEIIMEGVLAIKYGLGYGDIMENSHIFPTVAEGIKLTAQSFVRDLNKMSCCVE